VLGLGLNMLTLNYWNVVVGAFRQAIMKTLKVQEEIFENNLR